MGLCCGGCKLAAGTRVSLQSALNTPYIEYEPVFLSKIKKTELYKGHLKISTRENLPFLQGRYRHTSQTIILAVQINLVQRLPSQDLGLQLCHSLAHV